MAEGANRSIVFFPGQGAQKVGMGRAWAEQFPEARATFAEASEAIGDDLAHLAWEGPEDQLQLTRNAQPAILTVSVAIFRTLAARTGLAPQAVAGHSLGEYSAHVAAGTLSLHDAVKLVRLRGELMQEAVPVGVGAMAAILGLAPEVVAEVVAEAAQGDVCAVANYNSPEQTVIAGHRPAVERASALAKERGAKRALPLPVSAPFHCPLMSPARERLTPALRQAVFHDPVCPVITDIDARAISTAEAARDALIRQVDGPVRWVEVVRHAVAELGVTRAIEVGPGAVLTGLAKRIAPELDALSIAEPDALAKLGAS